MIGKITRVQPNGTWDGQYGTMYKFDYEFADGVCLQAMHKSKDGAFAVGDTVDYDITKKSDKFGNSGKVSKPKEQPFSAPKTENNWRAKDLAIIHQNALTQANSFYGVVGFDAKDKAACLNQLLDTADIIAKHVISKSGI